MLGVFDTNTTFFFGETVYPNGGRFGPVTHPHIVLITLISGRATISYDEKHFQIEAGQSTLFYAEKSGTVRIPRESDTHIMWCHTVHPTLLQHEKQYIQYIPTTIDTPEQLVKLLNMGCALGDSQGANISVLRNSLAVSTMISFIQAADNSDDIESHLPKSIEKVKRYIIENYREPLDLSILSKIASLSRQHLARKFKECLNMSPTEYIWQVRTEKGIGLLKRTGLSIREVAEKSGFLSQYHFSRLVKERYGISPSQVRKQAWQSSELKEKDKQKDFHF